MIERLGLSRIAEKENLPFHKEKQLQKAISIILARLFMPGMRVEGHDNIKEAQRMVRQEGKNIFLMANHLSYVDGTAIAEGLRRNGFKDLERQNIMLEGMKLRRYLITHFFASAQNAIWVWPKSLNPTSEKEKELRTKMTKDAHSSILASRNQGYNIVVFPEGTRSRDGKLQKGEPAISHYLNENTLVLPISIIGTEKVLAPGRPFFLPWQPTLTFGKPIEISSILKSNPNLTKDEKNKMIIGEIMKQIASNLPPKRRGVYA